MTINRTGCGLLENDHFREISEFLSKTPLILFFAHLLFSE